MLSRRRFITIAAAVAPSLALAKGNVVHVETATALGAKVTLRLDHPEAPRLAALAMAEIRRLEGVFSLYLPGSSLVALNRDSVLPDPPFELLDCLTIAGAVHRASGGRFDPTVQPLWQAEADALVAATPLTDDQRRALRARMGWDGVMLEPEAITLRPGMALTLNGIAQGYVADRVAALMADNGLTRALIDTGEMVALPEGDWPVHLADRSLTLQGRALATSSPLGMTFGNDGRTSHILNPATLRPTVPVWSAISISAPSAALADALSTAACLYDDRSGPETLCRQFADARVESAIEL